jgi:hypothetical protein
MTEKNRKSTARTAPSARESVYTSYGSVTLERTARQQYRVFMENVEIGVVSKGKLWQCGDGQSGYPDRVAAIKALIIKWSKVPLTPPAA